MEITEIPGYGGNYGITTEGQVFRIKKYKNSKDAPLSPSIVSGYPRVSLSVNRKVYNVHIHRLMAITFLDVENGLVVNHKDGDKTNNRLSNLEVCTYQYNEWHKRNVLEKRATPLAKLSEDQVREIRKIRETGASLSTIAKQFGLSKGNVSFIVRRETWKHVA